MITNPNNTHNELTNSLLIDIESQKTKNAVFINQSSYIKLSHKEYLKLLIKLIWQFISIHTSKVVMLIIIFNCSLKLYLYGSEIYTTSEYGIYIQGIMICSHGILKSSFLNNLALSNMLVTIFAYYIDVLCVTYIGN